MFALSALPLADVALWVDRTPGPVALAAAVLLLSSLLAAYAATRVVALPPLPHAEPVEASPSWSKRRGWSSRFACFTPPRVTQTALPAQREGARP